MANGIKTFKIVINGLTESISAVDALNKQLDSLEQRINKINSIKITATGGSGTSSRGSSGVLSEEAKLEKQIEQIEAKREVYSKEIYQNYLASKDQLNETLKDQKNIAAQERLRARTYSNTIRGLKEELSDIKETMQTIDLGDSAGLEKMTARADEINRKLKEIEESYGQFGRNVGNYKSVADGFNKIKVSVGGAVREYDNYRQAMKTLRNEEFQLAQTLGKESEEYKNVHVAVKELESTYKDLSKSSAFMDNMLDSMQTLTSFGQIGVGLTSIFGIDNKDYQESMARMMGLMSVLQGIEKIKQQWDADDSWLMRPFKKFYSYIEGASSKISDFLTKDTIKNYEDVQKRLAKLKDEMANNLANIPETPQNKLLRDANAYSLPILEKTLVELDKKIANTRNNIKLLGAALKWVGKVIMSIFTAGFMLMLPEIIQYLTDIVKSLNKAKVAAEGAEKALNSLNRTIETRMKLHGSSYLKGEISDEEYLRRVWDEQIVALNKQIDLLKVRADAAKDNGLLGTGWFASSKNVDFSGKKFTGDTTVTSGLFRLGLNVTVKDINEVEEAWKKADKAIKLGLDYVDAWGDRSNVFKRIWTGFDSWFTTIGNTENILKGMGNIKLSDTIAQFQELTQRMNEGKVTQDDYAKGLAKIREEMNNSEILNSVIANLDKYIPDEETRKALQNIINKIYELDDAFNMTSPEQIHHWRQIEIDSMKDGLEKTKAQIEENRRWQLQQEGKTAKQKELINKKYNREIQNAEEKHRQEQIEKAKAHADKLKNVDDWLAKLRIENMQKGWKKREAEIKLEWEQELRKAYEGGIKVKELEAEINKKYDTKIKEEKIKWASDMLRIYQDLAQNIQQINKTTFDTEASTASRNIQNKSAKRQQEVGYSMLTPNSYDDIKNLEEYYKKILDIKKNEADKEAAIERERLDKELEYAKEEENLRHERAIDASSGEYATQLKEGLITKEQYDELIEKENLAHNARMNAIDKEYLSNLDNVTKEELENTQQLYNDYYSKIISDISKKRSEIDSITSKQPVMDKQGWDVVNIAKTSSNYKTALKEYDGLKNDIIRKQRELEEALRAKSISPEDFAMREADIKKEMEAIDNAVNGVKQRQKMLIADFIQSIEKYLQEGIQAFQDIMQAVWDAQDNNFDKEQEYLDKLNKELDNKLNEQQDIVQKHKDAINDIEDELATSRGDRRQHLIDQLNAEMAAQRAAQQQEKKIQKEKEAAQKKADALDLKRKKAQYHRDMIQAVVNGALAVTRAADNSWPIPAVPMMALAAATTAAQIAIMASNKPYRVGGQLESGLVHGKRHSQGGVPVGNTGIEVEGDEYIIRRESTMPNVDLLTYINKSQRKLRLDDFIDYFSSGKPKKNFISMSPKTKYAEGGIIPTLLSDIDISDRLITAMEDYSNRPVVVEVTEIMNKIDSVRRVQTLAGLT